MPFSATAGSWYESCEVLVTCQITAFYSYFHLSFMFQHLTSLVALQANSSGLIGSNI